MKIWILLFCAAVRSADEDDPDREKLTYDPPSRHQIHNQNSNKCALVGKVFVAYLLCQGAYCAYKWYIFTPENLNTSQPPNQNLQTVGSSEKAIFSAVTCYVGECLIGSGSLLKKAFQFSKNRLSKLFPSKDESKWTVAEYYGKVQEVKSDVYYGHSPQMLHRIVSLQRSKGKHIIFFAGDSSLNNKQWALQDLKNGSFSTPVNGFEELVEKSVPDVEFLMNKILVENGKNFAAVNAAVEANSVASSEKKIHRSQMSYDFIKAQLTHEDILIVSLGGNDFALNKPEHREARSMLPRLLKNDSNAEKYLVDLFGKRVEGIIRNQLIGREMPKSVVVAMIYYPATGGFTPEWLKPFLEAFYDKDPSRLQMIIRAMFEKGTKRIQIQGTNVIPVALFDLLNANDTKDYVIRIEPSIQGGEKIAIGYYDAIFNQNKQISEGPDAKSKKEEIRRI